MGRREAAGEGGGRRRRRRAQEETRGIEGRADRAGRIRLSGAIGRLRGLADSSGELVFWGTGNGSNDD